MLGALLAAPRPHEKKPSGGSEPQRSSAVLRRQWQGPELNPNFLDSGAQACCSQGSKTVNSLGLHGICRAYDRKWHKAWAL